MVSLSSYDTLGQNGMTMMQNSLNTAGAASNHILENGADPMAIAEGSIALSQAKVEMAVGTWLVKQQNELMETSLQLFGIGQNFSKTF